MGNNSGLTQGGISYPLGVDAGDWAAAFRELAESVDAAIRANFLATSFPVGSIYISTSPTNPAATFGGVWQAWGQGRFPVGVGRDAGDTAFPPAQGAGHVGGSREHAHSLAPGHAQVVLEPTLSRNIRLNRVPTPPWTSAIQIDGSPAAPGGLSNAHATPLGGDTAQAAHLPPYITCFMWQRTA